MTSRDYARLTPCAAFALAAGILIGRASAGWLVFLPLLLCACAALWLMKWPHRMVAVMAVVLAVGGLAGYAAYHPALPEEGEYLVSGVVTEEFRLREDGQVRSFLRDVTLNGKPLYSGAYWTFYLREDETLPEGLKPGRRVTMTAEAYHPGGADNPGGFDFREYLLQRGATIGVYGCGDLQTAFSWHPVGVAAGIRQALNERLVHVMGEEAGSYAATMLLGSRDLIPQEDRDAFAHLGIAHILSVSGFHVGVLTGMLGWLLRKMQVSRRARFAVSVVVLAVYCLLTGLNPPVIRAALLLLLFEFGALKHRQRSSIHLLCVSFMAQLVVSPVQLTSVSFQLTYGAMLGLTVVTPWLQSLWEPRHPKPWRALCAALGAQAGILLPELYWFQKVPLLGIALNVVVLTLTTGVMFLCWITLFLLPVPQLAEAVGWLTARLLDGMLWGVRTMDAWPGVSLWTCRANLVTAAAWALLLLALSWWWLGKRRWLGMAAGVLLLAASVFPWPNTGSRYVQLSVGEADAAVLQDEGFTMAIDTGEDGEALSSYLLQRRLPLDALVLTHLHIDHAGGIAALMENDIPITACYLPWGALEADVDETVLDALLRLSESGTELIEMGRGNSILLPNGRLEVLWPEMGKVRPGQEANESSLALYVEIYGSSMLLTGDLDGVYEMYAACPADVLKVAHHGSSGSTSQQFLQAVEPQLLLLSCGKDSRSAAMAERKGNIPMADTNADGCVTLDFNVNGFTVETMR